MKDTIYREDAINAVEEALQNVFVEPKGLGEKIINPLPSAERTGKWIEGHRSGFNGVFHWYRECDQCGYERDDDDSEKDSVYKYCPNCGARMVE